MQPLIVPLDGSELSEAVLPWAGELARIDGLSLLLVRVVPARQVTLELGAGGEFQFTPEGSIAANRYLDAVAERLRSRGLVVRTQAREGIVATQILSVASERDAFAIAMTTRGRHGLDRLLSGSVASEVLRESKVPVLLVPASAAGRNLVTIRTIIVPLDGSPMAERALPIARALLTNGGQLVLVRSVDAREHRMHVDDPEAVDQRLGDTEAETYLSMVADRIRKSGVDTQTLLLGGRTTDQIDRSARMRDADLIVMATRGLTGLEKARFGSTAEELVQRSTCPVLLLSARMLAAKIGDQCLVRDVMNRDIPFIQVNESLASGMRKLLARGAAAVPVVDSEGKLVGVLTARKLLEWQTGLWQDAEVDPGEIWERADGIPVTDLVPNSAITIADTTTATVAALTLLDQQLDSLVVSHNGKPAGMVGVNEALGALSRLAGQHSSPFPSDKTGPR